MYGVAAVLAALNERRDSGRGQFIDLSLLDTQVAWLANQNLNYLVSGEAPGRRGTAHPNIVPYQAFRTSDGFLMLAVGNDAQFARFCAIAGVAGLAADPRFVTNQDRVAHRGELVPRLEGILLTRTSAAWLADLRNGQVPCGPINDLAQVFAEPQVRHRQLRLDLPHPLSGSVPGVRNPVLFSRTSLQYDRPPPPLGADTDEVLGQRLGLDPTALAALRTRGVVA
jgi:crotonobetainyl-CoA:carnitine CoA-transferase CaiB-like acyl-CoA transferase